MLTYMQSYTHTQAGMLRNCKIDLANWVRLGIREWCACRVFEEGYKQRHLGVGREGGGMCWGSGGCMHGWQPCMLSGCQGACKLDSQGRREINWWLMRGGSSSHGLGQHTRSPIASRVLTVLSYGLFRRSQSLSHMQFWGLVVKESLKVIVQTTRRCIYATICFTKREEAAADNNLMSWKLLRRYRSRDIFHGSEGVPFQMH